MSSALQLSKIRRTFPGVIALDAVDFELRCGEVHGLVGENGAGKSTLINLVSGVLQPDSGEIILAGRPVKIADPVAAINAGIVTVHQEAEFFPTLSVAENMALFSGLPKNSWGLVDWPTVRNNARQCVAAVGETIPIDRPAAELSVAHRHMTQIAAAVQQRASVVILDEPTSALTAAEAEWLFGQIKRLTQDGAGVIYISHRQEEIFRLADRITVLRDGQRIWTKAKSEVASEMLMRAMVGRDPVETRRENPESQEVRFRVKNLSDLQGGFANLTFELKEGEVLGVYGLVGAGRTELAEAIFGLRPLAGGEMMLNEATYRPTGPAHAVAAGIGYVPEDRLRQGVFRGLDVRTNLVISTLSQWARGRIFTDTAAENEAAQSITSKLAVKLRSIRQNIGQLSGGNQQKVVLGRWLLANPRLLILDEPTRGVDVGAKAEIHQLLRDIAKSGCSILMISSELEEVLEHSHRILVLREGEIAAEFSSDNAAPEDIATAAFPDSSLGVDQTESIQRSNGIVGKPLWSSIPFGELGLGLLVSLLLIWLGLTSENFFNLTNLSNLLSETALWTILGLAAAVTIIAGGIDISIGSLIAVSAAAAGLVLKMDLPVGIAIPLAILASLFVGVSGGLLNGALSLVGRIHPIVVTLGMIFFYRGIAIAILRGRQINELPAQFGFLAIHPQSGFRGGILFGAAVAALLYALLAHTRFGRHLYALGSSPSAARLIGLSKSKIWLGAFALSGLLIGVAAIIELASSMQMQAQLAKGWELQAIAVAVIGGVSITGGRGSIVGVFLGALLLQLVNSALVRWEIQGSQVDLVVGALILVAVIVDVAWRKLER